MTNLRLFDSASEGRCSIVAARFNIWGKGGRIALQDACSGGRSLLRMGGVVKAVAALALRRTQPSCVEAIAVKLQTCQKLTLFHLLETRGGVP